jgi:hypothetical protein
MTRRKVLDHWTEVHRVIGPDEVKVTTCCCAAPGGSRRGCATVQGNKSPCRCFCHSAESQRQWLERRKREGR